MSDPGPWHIAHVHCMHRVLWDVYWIIFVTTSNSAFNSRKQIYMHEIKIQKYHYFNQCNLEICLPHKQPQLSWLCKKNPQISLLKIMHPEILVVLYIHGHVYKNIHWIIFVTTSNSAFNSRKQIYIHEIKIQKYHYFNQWIWRFAYHTSNHNYHEYKCVYYIKTNAAANNNNKVTG